MHLLMQQADKGGGSPGKPELAQLRWPHPPRLGALWGEDKGGVLDLSVPSPQAQSCQVDAYTF